MQFLFKLCLFAIGYFTINIAFASAGEKVIPPVVVSKQHFQSSTASNAHKSTISQADIINSGADNLTEVLQSTPGLQIHDLNGAGNQVLISMRGFGANASNNSLLLINGVPLNNPDLAPPNLNIIPLQDIDHIEVIDGSEGVLYGDQAVGGVINMITKKNFNKHILLSCALGSYASHNCFAMLANHWRHWSYRLTLLNQHNNNYRHHNAYDQSLISGDLNYAYQQGNLNFEYRLSKEHLLFPGALTAQQVIVNPRQASNYIDYFDNWNAFYHLQSQQRLTTNWYLTTDLAHWNMQGNGVLTSAFTQSRGVNFIKPQLKGKIANIKVDAGLEFEDDDYYLKSLLGKNASDAKRYAIFTLFNIPLTQRLDFSLGGRLAQQKKSWENNCKHHDRNNADATTIGMSYQMNDRMKLSLRRAESFRLPKADELTTINEKQALLRTQKGASYEANIEWLSEKTLINLSLYQLNLNNEIAFDPTQTLQHPFGINRNLPLTSRQGFSFKQSYRWTDKLTLMAQYDYVYARFNSGINTGKRIPLVAENMLHANITYALTQSWKWYIEGVYTGNQYASNDDSNIGGRLGGYTLYNTNISYEFKKFSLAFRINNIFDKRYFSYVVYVPNAVSEFFYPAPGRNFLLTLKYDFA